MCGPHDPLPPCQERLFPIHRVKPSPQKLRQVAGRLPPLRSDRMVRRLWSEPEPTLSDRFYCPDPPRNGRYWLRADEARHLARVTRHAVGDEVELFDGQGFATSARVMEIGRDLVELVAEGEPIADTGPACQLTLASAIPKGDRFDWLVEKATELGVARLIPLATERSVVDPRDSKLDRLRRTIVESCKQCRRSRLMVLESAMSWPDLVRSESQALRLIASPAGLPPCRWPKVDRPTVVLAVGPEGGFSPVEEELARGLGWHSICLEQPGLTNRNRGGGRRRDDSGPE